jgi:MerR family transcriptional regulator, light-induced transcriptional regulator
MSWTKYDLFIIIFNYSTYFYFCHRQIMSKSEAALSIASIERDTGLSKDTLRAWERRYGFPAPRRDTFGERAYPIEQFEKLRVIKRLLDRGHRPGRVVAQSLPDLLNLEASCSRHADPARAAPDIEVKNCLGLIQARDVEGLRRALGQAQMRLGLADFVTDLVAPLNVLVGEAWACNQLDVYEEHIYTESVQNLLRSGIHSVPVPAEQARPRVVLTTFPKESHGLGLLMAETFLALGGCPCLSLGTQTPVSDISRAATTYRADIVALGFTASGNVNAVINSLIELRQALPEAVDIWAGGQCPTLQRRDAPSVLRIGALPEIQAQLAHWRAAHT